MKSAGLLKGWRMHGRRGMVNHLPLHPRAPCQSCSGVGSSSRDSTSAIEHCRTAPWHLPPFFGDWGVLWCLARCSFRAHEVRRQRLFPHLCVDGASVDLLALFFFSFKRGDICPAHRVETRPGLFCMAPCLLEWRLCGFNYDMEARVKGGELVLTCRVTEHTAHQWCQ